MPPRLPAVVLATGALLAAGCSRGCDEGDGAGPTATEPDVNVLLIVVDTLRADLLGVYGEARPTSPRIDDWAVGGTRFTRVTAAASTTLHSVTSMLTGRYGHTHGVYRNGVRWPDDLEGLPTHFRDAGYETAGFVASHALHSDHGIDRGFDFWNEPEGHEWRRGEEMTDAVVEWLDRADEEPFFALVHYFDPHYPYMPPGRYRDLFDPGYEGNVRGTLADVTRMRERLERRDGRPDDDVEHLAALHLGEIRYMDDQVGRLLDEIERRGLDERTLVMFTADHGETLLEHDVRHFEHGTTVYDTEVRVPLVFAGPEMAEDREVSRPLSNIDLAPTLLEWAGLKIPEGTEGRSFLPVLRGRGDPVDARRQFSEGTKPHRPGDGWPNRKLARCVVEGRYKVLHFPWLGDRWEMYDLEKDPLEQNDLWADAELEETRNRLARELRAWSDITPEEGGLGSFIDDSSLIEKLRALGYGE